MLIGHQKQWEILKRMADLKKIPHALMFVGQEQIGKKETAVEFLKLISGKDLSQSPDFHLVEPVESEIQIGQIRDLNWKLSLKTFSSSVKAALIDKAHLMNHESQNCFLKTLEEPKGDTLIILITEHPNLLLPTIRSRVQKLNFYRVGKKEIKDYLKESGLPEKEIEIVSEISAGSPGVAIDFLKDPEKLKNFRKRIREFTDILNSDLAERFRYAKELSQEDFKETLNIWLSYFRNILHSKMELQKNWTVLSKEYTLDKIKDILKLIENTIFITSTTNVNPRLALEVLLIDI